MTKCLLDSPEYRLTTGGLWRLIWSLISRHPGFSNWLIVDKRHDWEFRLTVAEQEAMSRFAEHSGAMMLSPDFTSLSSQQKNNYEMTVVADIVEALVAARNGDQEKWERLCSMDRLEFVEYAFEQIRGSPSKGGPTLH